MPTNAEDGKSTISPVDYVAAMLDEIETPTRFHMNFDVAY